MKEVSHTINTTSVRANSHLHPILNRTKPGHLLSRLPPPNLNPNHLLPFRRLTTSGFCILFFSTVDTDFEIRSLGKYFAGRTYRSRRLSSSFPCIIITHTSHGPSQPLRLTSTSHDELEWLTGRGEEEEEEDTRKKQIPVSLVSFDVILHQFSPLHCFQNHRLHAPQACRLYQFRAQAKPPTHLCYWYLRYVAYIPSCTRHPFGASTRKGRGLKCSHSVRANPHLHFILNRTKPGLLHSRSRLPLPNLNPNHPLPFRRLTTSGFCILFFSTVDTDFEIRSLGKCFAGRTYRSRRLSSSFPCRIITHTSHGPSQPLRLTSTTSSNESSPASESTN
ncbi:hypothetical protein C8R42DRAFT_291799 [Lentinula raphanica]|nr:hypothetical protein C8R42DRAFT_291799 [Lentinula raphanica]